MQIRFEHDNHFLIGREHINGGSSCQDYALSGLLDGGAAYAIVADGCSSGGRTDMGARVLSFATSTAIQQHWSITQTSADQSVPKQIAFYQHASMASVQALLKLRADDLFATCAYVFVSPSGGFIHMQGDGVIAYRFTDGRIGMTRFDWANNTPCYLAYTADYFEGFIATHGGDIQSSKFTAESRQISSTGCVSDPEITTYTLGEGIQGITRMFSAEDLSNLAYIGVFSDGVTRVTQREWYDVVQQLFAFKTTNGQFVTRRLVRFVEDASFAGQMAMDDIACAVLKVIHQ